MNSSSPYTESNEWHAWLCIFLSRWCSFCCKNWTISINLSALSTMTLSLARLFKIELVTFDICNCMWLYSRSVRKMTQWQGGSPKICDCVPKTIRFFFSLNKNKRYEIKRSKTKNAVGCWSHIYLLNKQTDVFTLHRR